MSVSIGIVTKNRSEYLSDCLDSVLAQTAKPLELLIFNDGSTDNTSEVVESKRSEFQKRETHFLYLFSEKATSLPYGRNKILENARGDILAYLDDDTLCTKSWLANIRDSFDRANVGGVGGPAIRVGMDLKPIWPEIRTAKNMNVINKFGESRDYCDNWIPPSKVRTHIIRGANMAFRRTLIKKYGGFDENYFGRAFMEDVDLQVTLRKRGFELIYSPDVLVYHRVVPIGGANLKDKKEDWYSVGYTSSYFIKKHYARYRALTLIRLFFRLRYSPIPVPKLLLEVIKRKSTAPFWALKGFLRHYRIGKKKTIQRL